MVSESGLPWIKTGGWSGQEAIEGLLISLTNPDSCGPVG